MKSINILFIPAAGVLLFLLPLIFVTQCERYPLAGDYEFPDKYGEYMGAEFPGTVPVRFLPDVFVEQLRTAPVFTPDGSEVYFKPRATVGFSNIFVMKMEGDRWTMAQPASFNFESINDAPFISPDGERLYFLSAETSFIPGYEENIYVVKRQGDDWSAPEILPELINTYEVHRQFSVAANYNLYFTDDGSDDICRSEFIDGEYLTPVKLPATVNSPSQEEGSPFIAPDESYLLFDRQQGGNSDLLISFNLGGQEWSEPVDLGPEINTDGDELYACVTSDERFIIFLRRNDEGTFPYWVDASVIDGLRK